MALVSLNSENLRVILEALDCLEENIQYSGEIDKCIEEIRKARIKIRSAS